MPYKQHSMSCSREPRLQDGPRSRGHIPPLMLNCSVSAIAWSQKTYICICTAAAGGTQPAVGAYLLIRI